MNLQPILQSDLITLLPLKESHIEELYAAASDIETWNQHPNPLRYQREHFDVYCNGALQSNSAFVIVDNATNTIIGSSRYYGYDDADNSILIGYTFFTYTYFGKGYNANCKKLMLDYIFQYVEKVIFHVGEKNIRSQKAMLKLGGKLVGTASVNYFGEPPNQNVIFEIKKQDWNKE
jgi:N-acetyltransferase